MKITHTNEKLAGSMGRVVATRVECGNKEEWQKFFNVCSDLLGEIAPLEDENSFFYGDRWASTMTNRRYRKWIVTIFEKSDAKLVLHEHSKQS